MEILNNSRNSRQPNQTRCLIRMGHGIIAGPKNNADIAHCSCPVFHLATIQQELISHP